MENQEAPEIESQEPAEQDESAIIDQIGALLQQLAPEKQSMVLDQLKQLIGGGQDVVSPEQGANGVPVGM